MVCRIYGAALWRRYKIGYLSKLKSAYYKCMNIFLDYDGSYSVTQLLLGHPTYLSADLGFTAILLSSIFYFRQLPSELAERNSAKTGHMLESKVDFKKFGVSPP